MRLLIGVVFLAGAGASVVLGGTETGLHHSHINSAGHQAAHPGPHGPHSTAHHAPHPTADHAIHRTVHKAAAQVAHPAAHPAAHHIAHPAAHHIVKHAAHNPALTPAHDATVIAALNIANPHRITVPATVPSNALPVIASDFLGFFFEETSLEMYAGPPGHPNTFSVNLLNGITSRTGSKPSIRVGGTSLDYAKYIPSQKDAVRFPPGQTRNTVRGVTLGPSYFQQFKNFADAKYTFCLPLATGNLANTVAMAKAGYPAIKDQVEYIEIGNEPNSYPGRGRPSKYSPHDYVAEVRRYSKAVSKALGLKPDSRKYQAVALGSPDHFQNSDSKVAPGPWYPNALFEAGLASSVGEIGAVSMHWYQTLGKVNDPGQLQKELMNHNIMVNKMSYYQPAIDYFAAHYPKIRVNMAEAGSSLNGAKNDYALESTFGAALWQVDWLLWCMKMGFHRIAWAQISASAFDLWQPVMYKGRVPAVLPPYYAMLFAADFIGKSGDTRVVNIDLKSDKHAAYAVYVSGKPARVAIVNLAFWNSAGKPRPSTTFHVKMPSGVSHVHVKHLRSPEGATASSGSAITWGGHKWTAASNGRAELVKDDTVIVQVVKGVAPIVVHSSEAVMVIPRY